MADSNPSIDRRTFIRATGVGALSVSVAGCSDADPNGTDEANGDEGSGEDTPPDATPDVDDPEPFEITVTQGQTATTLDPHDHRETSTRSVLLQTYERILFRDGEGSIVDLLATDWERVDDGEFRFEIREGVTFHDGESLTAADCAYSIQRVVDDDTHITSPQSGQLSGIVDAEARSDTDLRVYSDGFNPMVVANLATYCPVMNQAWTEARDPSEVAQETNGTGPYELVAYEADVEARFEAFDDYWGTAPVVAAATINAAGESSSRVAALQTDETDLITDVPPQDAPGLQDAASTHIAAVPSTRNLFVVLNDAAEPFNSRAFRQAMNYAVDLDSIIDNVLDGFGDPTGQPTIEGTLGHAADVEPYPYDPDRAAELVEQSGYAGTSFEIHTPTGRYLRDVEIAQSVAGYINDLPNVTCGVVQRDFASLVQEFTDGNQGTSPKAFLIGSSNPSRDASQKINSWLLPGAATSHVSDERFVELYDATQSERDGTVRTELLADINRLAHEEASLLFLHRQYSVYGLSDRINWTPRQDELVLLKDFERV